MRWAVALVLAAAGLLSLVAPISGAAQGEAQSATQTNLRATLVSVPPKVQLAGRTYRLRVRVINRGATFRPLCFDFTDDDGSWLVESPGRRGYDSDTFCAGTIRRGQARTILFL